MDKFLALAATLFGTGHVPKAPGTAGSFLALVLGSVLIHFINWQVFLAFIVALFFFGIAAAGAHEKIHKIHDSPKVVIDELVGMWIVLFPLEAFGTQLGGPRFIYDIVAGFVLFRLFDIWKPWPVSWAETKFKGGLGVMADDVVAGLLAAAALMGVGVFI